MYVIVVYTTYWAVFHVNLSLVGEKPTGVFALDGCTGAIDLSGNENDGTPFNVDPKVSGPNGDYAKATSFLGQSKDSYILLNNTGALDTFYSLSILLHIYTETPDGAVLVYSDGGCSLTLVNKILTFTAVSLDGSVVKTIGLSLAAMKEWYYVAAIFDSNAGVMTLSVNLKGQQLKTDAFSLNTVGSVWVGTNPEKDSYFSGKISCIQIFDRPLSSEQVREGMECPTGIGADLPGKDTLFRMYFFRWMTWPAMVVVVVVAVPSVLIC